MYCGTADAGDDGDDPEVQAAYNTFMNIARSINTEVCAVSYTHLTLPTNREV